MPYPLKPDDGHEAVDDGKGKCVLCGEELLWKPCVPVECPEPEEVVVYWDLTTETWQ